MRFLDPETATQSNESRHNNEKEDKYLEDSKEVLEAKTPLESGAVKQHGEGHARKGGQAECPSAWFLIEREQSVFAKY